jgi:hypothetical protein
MGSVTPNGKVSPARDEESLCRFESYTLRCLVFDLFSESKMADKLVTVNIKKHSKYTDKQPFWFVEIVTEEGTYHSTYSSKSTPEQITKDWQTDKSKWTKSTNNEVLDGVMNKAQSPYDRAKADLDKARADFDKTKDKDLSYSTKSTYDKVSLEQAKLAAWAAVKARREAKAVLDKATLAYDKAKLDYDEACNKATRAERAYTELP